MRLPITNDINCQNVVCLLYVVCVVAPAKQKMSPWSARGKMSQAYLLISGAHQSRLAIATKCHIWRQNYFCDCVLANGVTQPTSKLRAATDHNRWEITAVKPKSVVLLTTKQPHCNGHISSCNKKICESDVTCYRQQYMESQESTMRRPVAKIRAILNVIKK